ncbi:secG [Symbiodinium sp. CCMP2456]|nr:secG [Symbiodinium sp. CCMP2456]
MALPGAFLLALALAAAMADDTELRKAVVAGDREEVQNLLASQRFDVSQIRGGDYDGTLLHDASMAGHVEVLSLLLQAWPAGARALDSWGWTPLHRAAWAGNLKMVRMLMEAWPEGLRAVDSHGVTVIHSAAWSGDVEMVRMLMEAWPGGLRAVDSYGATVIHSAARSGNVEMVRMLMEAWPEGLRAVDSEGATVIHSAVWSGNVEMVRMLMEAWPGGPRALDILGRTPLDYIACSFMIQLGCNVSGDVPAWLPADLDMREAAINLNCDTVTEIRLSLEELQLWMACGGDLRWQDGSGLALVEKLEDQEAKNFLKARMASGEIAIKTLQDWRTWIFPGIAALAAFLAVRLEQLTLIFLRKRRQRISGGMHVFEEAQNPYEEGARVMVGRAFMRSRLLCRLWRWLEVLMAVFFFGFALLLMRPLGWLPLVSSFYFLPALKVFGMKKLLHDPSRAVFTTGLASQAAALLRTIVLFSIFFCFDGFLPDDPWALPFLNPIYSSFINAKLTGTWQYSFLNEHWLFQWSPPVNAATVFSLMRHACEVLIILYLISLSCAIGYGCACRSRHALRLPAPEAAVHDLLQRQPPQFDEVHSKLKPVVAFAWPCLGGGLWQSVMLVWLDMGFDVNTIVVLMAGRHYIFAAVMTFVVARSALKQMYIIPPWRLPQAIRASVQRGIVHQDLLHFLEEEKRSEALFSACFTAYTCYFAVQTAGELVIQFFSLLLSTFLFAEHAVQIVDIDFQVTLTGKPQAPVHNSCADEDDVLDAVAQQGSLLHPSEPDGLPCEQAGHEAAVIPQLFVAVGSIDSLTPEMRKLRVKAKSSGPSRERLEANSAVQAAAEAKILKM